MTATRRTRTLHGQQMSYVEACPEIVDEDDPEVVVLVHGIAGSAETWSPVLEAFERSGCDRLLLAPELLGHGESAGVGGDFSLGAYANGLRDLLAVLGHRRVTVVGHSLGGGVAMQFAYQFPEMCSRLVLVASGGLGRGVSPLLRLAALPGAEWVLPVLASSGVLDLGVRGLRLAAALPSLGAEAVSLRETARHAASLTERAHLDAFVDTVRAVIGPWGQRVSGTERLYLTEGLPTMIVWGDRDPVIPVGHAHRAASLVPHGRLELFGGAGHFPHCDEPDRFAALLTDFCDTSAPADLSVDGIGPRVAARTG
ncbi:alpha/beta fold hydrolase [Actinomycetospora flava]|uniref:Alpha/beta hydrolase n=1 Tax=Actinomycetospora flava TaxID=3129232 RepID=A0ABU8MF85_9PSEU